MEYELLAAEVLRALRGRRSQTAFSRRLGYQSNVCYRWENAIAFPTAAGAFKAAQLCGVDTKAGLLRFYRSEPEWLHRVKPASSAGVAELLRSLVGSSPIGEVAKRAHRSRFAVSRWLKGEAEPRLPELLLMVDVVSQRLLDFLTVFTDPSQLPSVAAEWAELLAAREAAYSSPWSQAVLRVLEIEDYRRLERHEPGWIAKRLGISREEEERCLTLLAESRQIRRGGRLWQRDMTRAVDTRADPKRSLDARSFWTEVAIERVRRGFLNQGGYAVFSLSEADLAKVVQLSREFHDRVRATVTASEPSERVILMTNHFVALEDPVTLGRDVLEISSAPPSPKRTRAARNSAKKPQIKRG